MTDNRRKTATKNNARAARGKGSQKTTVYALVNAGCRALQRADGGNPGFHTTDNGEVTTCHDENLVFKAVPVDANERKSVDKFRTALRTQCTICLETGGALTLRLNCCRIVVVSITEHDATYPMLPLFPTPNSDLCTPAASFWEWCFSPQAWPQRNELGRDTCRCYVSHLIRSYFAFIEMSLEEIYTIKHEGAREVTDVLQMLLRSFRNLQQLTLFSHDSGNRITITDIGKLAAALWRSLDGQSGRLDLAREYVTLERGTNPFVFWRALVTTAAEHEDILAPHFNIQPVPFLAGLLFQDTPITSVMESVTSSFLTLVLARVARSVTKCGVMDSCETVNELVQLLHENTGRKTLEEIQYYAYVFLVIEALARTPRMTQENLIVLVDNARARVSEEESLTALLNLISLSSGRELTDAHVAEWLLLAGKPENKKGKVFSLDALCSTSGVPTGLAAVIAATRAKAIAIQEKTAADLATLAECGAAVAKNDDIFEIDMFRQFGGRNQGNIERSHQFKNIVAGATKRGNVQAVLFMLKFIERMGKAAPLGVRRFRKIVRRCSQELSESDRQCILFATATADILKGQNVGADMARLLTRHAIQPAAVFAPQRDAEQERIVWTPYARDAQEDTKAFVVRTEELLQKAALQLECSICFVDMERGDAVYVHSDRRHAAAPLCSTCIDRVGDTCPFCRIPRSKWT